MFEKTITMTAKILYIPSAIIGIAWLAWLCFAHLPLGAALFLFPLALVLSATAAAPLIAGAAFAIGLLVASLGFVSHKVLDLVARRA